MSEPLPPEDLPDPPTLEDPDPIPPPVDFPDGDEVVGWLDAEVSGDRVNVFDAPIVAGDPDGARVEVAADGLHAYDSTGTETATIDGGSAIIRGGVFDGGQVVVRTPDGTPIGTINSVGMRITNPSGQEMVHLTPAAQAGAPGINFPMPGYAGGTPPQVVAFSVNNTGGFAAGTLLLKSAEATPNVSGRGEVRVGVDRVYVGMPSGPDALTALTLAGGSAQIASRNNSSRVVAGESGNAELISSGGSSAKADSLGNASLTGKLDNRVLAVDTGNVEMQSSGGSTVLADSLGAAKMEGVLGNRVLAADTGNVELQSSAGAVVNADSVGGAKMEGALGNRVLAGRFGSAELQSSGGSTVLADSLGGAQMEGEPGNLIVAGSNGTSAVRSSAGSSVTAFVSGGAQMTSAGGGIVVAHAAGESSMWANNTERIRATAAGVKVTGALTVGTTDVMAKIAALEARIAALEA